MVNVMGARFWAGMDFRQKIKSVQSKTMCARHMADLAAMAKANGKEANGKEANGKQRTYEEVRSVQAI